MGLKVRKAESVPQASRVFTDREIPRKSFWKNYNDFKSKMNDGDIKVLAYYGIGGIGKSTLLRKLISEMDEAKAAGIISDSLHVYFDLNLKQDFRAVLENIRNKLIDDYGFDFPLFDLGCYIYAKKIGDNAEKKEAQTYIGKSRALNVAFDIVKEIPVVGLAARILSIADRSFAIYRNTFEKHKDVLIKIEGKSAEELYDYLPLLFSKDLSSNLEKKMEPLVIFLDTYEQFVNEMATIGEPLNNDLVLRDENDGIILNTPKVFWVIAGREKLKWQKFMDWGDSLEQHILGNLSSTDAHNFLLNAGINDEKLRSGIYTLTQGTPVYLDLCIDRYISLLESGRTPKIEDFGQNIFALIERFARYMDDAKKDVVYILSCLMLWSDDMVFEIGPKVLQNFSLTTYEKVKGFSFVTESEKYHYNLHQTVCGILYKNCPEIIKQKTISAAIDYCKNKLEKVNVCSSEYEYYVGWLMKYAIEYFEEDEQLRVFYIEQIREYLKKISDAKRFKAIDELFEPFWERASKDKNARLFALAQKDYCIWLQSLGKYQDALEMANNSYELYIKLLGEDDAATLRAQRELGIITKVVGQHHKSLEILKVVLEKRIKFFGENNSETIESYAEMSEAYKSIGDYNSQFQCIKKMYEISVRLFKPDSPEVFKAQRALAIGYTWQGFYDKGLEIIKPLSEEVELVLGEDNITTIDVLVTYASILEKKGEYNEVLSLQKDIYERRNRILGENHPKTLEATVALAKAYDKMGRYSDALPLRELVLEKRRTLFGELHPKTLKAIWGVAYNLEQLGRYQEALKLRLEIYEKYRQTQGDDFPDTIVALGNVAGCYSYLGAFEKNLELRKEIYARRNCLLGENHPDTIDALACIASCYKNLGEFEKSLSIIKEVCEKIQAKFGYEHPKAISARLSLATLYENMGRFDDAIALQKERLEIRRRISGEKSHWTIKALNSLAWAYFLKGTPDEGIVYAEEMKVKMDENPDFGLKEQIGNLDTLALLYAQAGRFEESFSLALKLLNDSQEKYPSNKEFISDRHYALAFVLNKMERYNEALEYCNKSLEVRKNLLGEFNEATQRAQSLMEEIKENLSSQKI